MHALGGATSRALSSLRGGGESRTQGVSVDLRDDGVDLDVTLVVTYGVNIPQVAEACRDAVKEQVEGSTGLYRPRHQRRRQRRLLPGGAR